LPGHKELTLSTKSFRISWYLICQNKTKVCWFRVISDWGPIFTPGQRQGTRVNEHLRLVSAAVHTIHAPPGEGACNAMVTHVSFSSGETPCSASAMALKASCHVLSFGKTRVTWRWWFVGDDTFFFLFFFLKFTLIYQWFRVIFSFYYHSKFNFYFFYCYFFLMDSFIEFILFFQFHSSILIFKLSSHFFL